MSKTIPLSKGKCTIVDDGDYEWLSQWKWCYLSSATGYAIRQERVQGKIKGVLMHRAILDVPQGMYTDHINHDGLDNQRANLRICTPSENKAHSRKYKNNKSGYMGVHRDKDRGKWTAQINSNHYLGRFDDPMKAARAYDKAALELHGEFATLNFPSDLGA